MKKKSNQEQIETPKKIGRYEDFIKGYLKIVSFGGGRCGFVSFREGGPCKLVSQAVKEIIVVATAAIRGVGGANSRFQGGVEVREGGKGVRLVGELSGEGEKRGLKGSRHGRGGNGGQRKLGKGRGWERRIK